jgi:hypothetical protein
MTPELRKFILTVHLVFSIGWIGAVVTYLVLGVSAVTTAHPETVRVAWVTMEITGWYAIVPLAVGSLLTGILIALVTPWGLFRHSWVLISFALTVFSVTVLLLHMPTVSAQARAARGADPAVLGGLGGDLFHPSAGLFILLVVTVLNVYKPRGLTLYGRRKQLALRGQDDDVSTATGAQLGEDLCDCRPRDTAGVSAVASSAGRGHGPPLSGARERDESRNISWIRSHSTMCPAWVIIVCLPSRRTDRSPRHGERRIRSTPATNRF